MKLDEREELLAAHALGALSGAEAREVEALVAGDAGAAEQLAMYREIARLLGIETPQRPADPAVLERMVRSVRRMRRSSGRRFSVLRAATFAASLAVAAVLGGLLGARLDSGAPAVLPERGGAWPPPPLSGHAAGYSVDAREVLVELRVWQNVDDPWDVWVRAYPQGESGEPPEPVPFPLDEADRDFATASVHSYRDLAVGGATLRLLQRLRSPELIFVRLCPTPCTLSLDETDPRGEVPVWEWWPWQTGWWTPRGMNALPLDAGYSELGSARYRFGDLTIAVPVGNPELAADREYLLALRDELAGTATLNWSVATPTVEWEGVRLTGWPPRVTGRDLANRALDGEILGWLGDLTELTELRLDGNSLTGALPPKLAQLTRLTQVGLAGNSLQGCVPPSLRDARYHDLASLGLPDCDPPTLVLDRTPSRDWPTWGGGTYRWQISGDHFIFDLPAGLEFRVGRGGPQLPSEVRQAGVLIGDRTWLFLSYWNAMEIRRSHYEEDAPVSSWILDRIAASVWHTTGDNADEWVWP